MRLLFIGDVTAEPGLRAVRLHLPDIRDRYHLHYRELREAGVDAITLGNHAFDKKEILEFIETEPIVRAANYPPGVPGKDPRLSLPDG